MRMKNDLRGKKPEIQGDLRKKKANSKFTKHCVVVPGAGFELATSGRLASTLSRL